MITKKVLMQRELETVFADNVEKLINMETY